MSKIIIQGLGFVGSAMAVAIASRKDDNDNYIFKVTGVDLNNKSGVDRIKKINSGIFPFQTNDDRLQFELAKCIEHGNLTATYDTDVYSDADVIIINMNCDIINDGNNSRVDLDPFVNGIRSIAEKVKENTLIIVETTVPTGTCEKIIYPIFVKAFKNRNLDINKLFLSHSYERVMPGSDYLNSIINFWRVYAGINDDSADKCGEFLSKIINTTDYPLTRLANTNESETGKLLENSYRAVNIAFIEEWGRFAEDIGLDLYSIINAIRMRPTHSNLMQPGFGVGGYCLTKDPLFAKIAARDIYNTSGHDFLFSSKAIKINKNMPYVSVNKIKKYFNGSLDGVNILLLGASYRQDVGDTRYSPSETFVNAVKLDKANISVYDPLVTKWEGADIQMEKDLPNLSDYDVVVFCVKHKEFMEIDIVQWVKDYKILIFDANNVLTKRQASDIKRNKIRYISIGRG